MVDVNTLIAAISKRQAVLNADEVSSCDGVIAGVATLERATLDKVSFLANTKYVSRLAECKAGVVLVSPEFADKVPSSALPIIVKNPYLAFACVSQLFEKKQPTETFNCIHPTAVIDERAKLGQNIAIGANVVIGAHVVVGDGTRIGNNTVIEDGVQLGQRCYLYHNVSVHHDCVLGDDCIVHSGAVIGADGFGFAPSTNPSEQGWERIAQLGRAVIGNRVRIGANTCIDRGAVDDTIIGDDVIIDNLVQIAHNVKIGQGTAIAGTVAIAGSTSIGKGCAIGGGVGIVGHLQIGDFITLTARTFVTKSLDKAGTYSSGTVAMPTNDWRRATVKFRQMGKH